MIAYRVFEIVTISGFVIYSLRQVLPLFPNLAARIGAAAKAIGISPQLLLPARFTAKNDSGCSSCSNCAGCAPAATTKPKVITLHRSNTNR